MPRCVRSVSTVIRRHDQTPFPCEDARVAVRQHGEQMRTAIHWIASIAAAGLIVFVLLKLLAADMARHWVIAIGGLAGILWSKFVDSPLKAWAQE
jgi:hypothetical protein